MTVERAGSKSLRVTATDSHNQVKVFLVMVSLFYNTYVSLSWKFSYLHCKLQTIHCVFLFHLQASPDEIGQLHKSLSTRVTQAKLREETSAVLKGTEAVTVAEDLPISEMEPDTCASDTAEDNQLDAGSQDCPEAQTAGNPVVIISAEGDEDSNQTSVLKRPLDSEDHREQSKKACMEPISNVPQLLNK